MEYHVSFPGLGLEFTVDRVAFTLFGVEVYWYGVLIALGMAIAMAFAFRQSKRFGVDSEKLADVIMVGVVGAIIGLRGLYVLFSPYKYNSFWDIINIRDGGLAIYGGIIGAVVFGALACKWRKVPVLPTLDLAAMGFLIGQCIGRWGNFTNQEVFGKNTTLPWGMISEGTTRYLTSMQATLAERGIMVDPYAPVHPTFLYESLWCLLGFVILYFFIKHRKYNGQIALMYVAWYGFGRAYLESIRTDTLMWGNVRVFLALGLATAAVATLLLVYFAVKYKAEKPLEDRLRSNSTSGEENELTDTKNDNNIDGYKCKNKEGLLENSTENEPKIEDKKRKEKSVTENSEKDTTLAKEEEDGENH